MRAAVLLALLVLAARTASAHTIRVDGSAADWFGVAPIVTNLGRIARDSVGEGEYVWSDAPGDARTGWNAYGHDLTLLGVTGDGSRLYVMARIAGPVVASGNGAPQLQVAIDTDRFYGSGGTAFAGDPATSVAPAGAYEWLVQTRFGSGAAPRVVDGSGAPVSAGATASLSATGVMEISLPWSTIGDGAPPLNPVRFSAALFVADAADQPLAAEDALPSRAADVVTLNGSPGASGTTAGEVADAVLDYTFDIWFDGRGDAIAPLVVSEVWFTGGAKSQWIEIANASQGLVPLGAFKLGDAPSPGSGGSMGQLPGSLLGPGECFVVARHGATYFSENGLAAGAECEPSDPATPDLLPFTSWASTTYFSVTAAGADVLLLDGSNTVVDVMSFKNGVAWPGVKKFPNTQSNHSLERSRVDIDTDDCAADFRDQPAPTPGLTVQLTAVGTATHRSALLWSPPRPNPARGGVTLELTVNGPANARVDLFDTGGRRVRTLLDGAVPASGALQLRWDGRDASGAAVTPGVYFARASTAHGSSTVRIVVLQ